MTIRAGIVGAGYIADWHAAAIAATPGVALTAVADPARGAAEALAGRHGARAFGSLGEMAAAGVCDAVHVLTPPNLHRALALEALAAGLHVLVEKPMALSAQEARQMAEAAAAAGRVLMPGHNFLCLPSWARLRGLVRDGALGLISEARIDWALPLAPLRSGPYGLWLLREPANLLYELGPHPFAFAVDLFGPLEIEAVSLGQPVELEGGGRRHQSWRVLARAGDVAVTIALSMVETVDDRSVTLRGSTARARMDYAADTLVVTPDNTADLIVNPLWKELGAAGRHLREGLRNAGRQAVSLNRKSPYGLSFRGLAAEFYGAIGGGATRLTPAHAVRVTEALDAVAARMPAVAAPAVVTGTPRPDVMVIGGTGFIGRNLTRALVARGRDVRVLSRGRHGPFADIADRVETVGVSLSDTAGLTEAMRGMRAVFNLAKSMDTTWEDALRNDVGTAVRVGEAALAAGVERLVYTGTIASYDMSDPAVTITEETGFGDLSARNLYARSKAECEARLMALHRDKGLPLVIARPGIVVGPGGPLQHWGIGRWHGAGAVRLWGNGRNILPFVLSRDVSEALIAMGEAPAAVGRSYNLVGEPMLTGRDYFDAIHARLGARLRVRSGNLTAMWAAGAVKWALKRHVLGQREAVRASLADWRARGHFARFDNARPKAELGWRPEAEREAFLRQAVDDAGLFGFRGQSGGGPA